MASMAMSSRLRYDAACFSGATRLALQWAPTPRLGLAPRDGRTAVRTIRRSTYASVRSRDSIPPREPMSSNERSERGIFDTVLGASPDVVGSLLVSLPVLSNER